MFAACGFEFDGLTEPDTSPTRRFEERLWRAQGVAMSSSRWNRAR